MIKARRIPGLMLCAVTVLLLAACGGQTRPAATTEIPVRLGVQAAVLSYAPFQLAEVGGIFKKHGINAELLTVLAANSSAALSKGDIEVNTISFMEFLRQLASGDKYTVVQITTSSVTMDLNMSKQFVQKATGGAKLSLKERAEKLKGTNLGTTSLGGPPDVFVRWLARKYGGLQAEKDFQVAQIGGGLPGLISATKAGQIDGFLLSPPAGQTLAQEGLGQVYIDHAEVPDWIGLPHNVIQVTRQQITQNPEMVRRTVAAIAEAMAMLNKETDKAADILLKSKYYDKTDPQVLRESLKQLRQAHEGKGQMTAATWEKSVAFAKELNMQVPDRVQEGPDWTNQFIPK